MCYKNSKGYKLYFQSSEYENTDEDTAEIVNQQLENMFAEIQEFEKKIAEKWND